jgi:hypothetical protein
MPCSAISGLIVRSTVCLIFAVSRSAASAAPDIALKENMAVAKRLSARNFIVLILRSGLHDWNEAKYPLFFVLRQSRIICRTQ